MSTLPKLLDAILEPILRKLGGWKSIIGVAIALITMTLDQMDYVGPDGAALLYEIAVVVFGIGIAHKAVRADRR